MPAGFSSKKKQHLNLGRTMALVLVATAGLSGCGGESGSGGGGAISAPSPTPPPPPAPPPPPSNGTFAATGGECDGTAGWQAIANDGIDDSAAIATSLQQAASKGDTLTIPAGTYNIDDPAGVTAIIANKSFSVIATGAIFVAGPAVNSDLIEFDVRTGSFNGPCGGTDVVDISWSGGEIDISRAHLSGTVPQGTGVGATTVGSPVAGTTDGFSIRGIVGGTSSLATSPPLKVGSVTVSGLTVVAAPISAPDRIAYFQDPDTAPPVDSESDSWRNAGGDSGVFITGVGSALVEDSAFFGIRDASIYMSASPFDGNRGGNYVLRNNRFYGGFDGISSKRGAQNIRMEGNLFVNVVRAASLESLSGPLRSTNNQTAERTVTPVVISNNTFVGVQRAIQLESAANVTVNNNVIRHLGAKVSGQNNPVRYSRYEGIVVEGVSNAEISNNRISGVDGARATASNTVGITVGSHAGIAGSIPSANVTITPDNILTGLDSDIE